MNDQHSTRVQQIARQLKLPDNFRTIDLLLASDGLQVRLWECDQGLGPFGGAISYFDGRLRVSRVRGKPPLVRVDLEKCREGATPPATRFYRRDHVHSWLMFHHWPRLKLTRYSPFETANFDLIDIGVW